ncbi:MAG TPA: ABC transporter substrate-binding protein [Thermoleophilia bacterium]|nr:ABC transporter substrate-binding protein [Thermoleophilia bacterium]
MGRFLIIVACAALLLVMPSGASAGASSSPAPAATVLRLGTTQDLDSLNPFAGYTSVAYEVYHLNYDMLTGSAPDGDVRPEIADSWAMSEDGLTWTFRIHPGIRWQDGVPLTARDVAFTFNYIIDNELSAFTGSTTHIKKAVAVDDTTVEFRLERPKSNMLRLPIPILPEHIWAKVPGDEAATFAPEPPVIGSGPFQVVEVKKGSYVRLVANTDYWKGAPKIDEAIIEIYQNQDTMAMDLRSGTIDVAEDLPAAQFSALQNAPGITAKAADIRYFVEVAMNVYQDEDSLANPVLRDVAFRRAISWAVDKHAIVETCLGGYGAVGQSIIVPGTDGAWAPSAEEAFGFDLTKAGAMLDAAGYRDADGDGIREDKQGAPIELRLWTRSESPEQQRAGKLIAGWLGQLGLKIQLSVENDGALVDGVYHYEGEDYAPDYDLFIWGWGSIADPGYQLGFFTSSQIEGWNDCCWSNAEYDGLFVQQDAEMDWPKRELQVQRMQQIFYADAPYMVLYYPKALIAYNTAKWEGWVPYPGDNGMVVFSNDNIDSYVQVHPRAASETAAETEGPDTALIAGVAAAALAVAAIVLLLRRRGRAVEQ